MKQIISLLPLKFAATVLLFDASLLNAVSIRKRKQQPTQILIVMEYRKTFLKYSNKPQTVQQHLLPAELTWKDLIKPLTKAY